MMMALSPKASPWTGYNSAHSSERFFSQDGQNDEYGIR
jgi:hypothetical protein